jgi:hypothetical protein
LPELLEESPLADNKSKNSEEEEKENTPQNIEQNQENVENEHKNENGAKAQLMLPSTGESPIKISKLLKKK